MSELLPCPFCGGDAHTIEPARYGKTWGVRCECGAFLGFEHTEAEAIEAWNTRAEMGYEDTLILLDELGVSELEAELEDAKAEIRRLEAQGEYMCRQIVKAKEALR